MPKSQEITLFLLVLIGALALNGCAAQPVMGAELEQATVETSTPSDESEPLTKEPSPVPTQAALPAGLEKITAENADAVRQLAVIQPDFPPYELISPDGRMGARANLDGIDVFEMDSGKLAAHIDVALPDCQYGWDRYFSFNQDGSFIAVAGRNAIQVWQVGGGLVFESPYSLQNSNDTDTCGAEIPQLALSPDASLLAVSGVTYTRNSADAYFRVVATLQNQVLYEWDGNRESLHGDLYTFRGLGFSTDGSVLQTFDPSRYYAFSGEEYQAFRFWSVDGWQELPRSSETIGKFRKTGQLYVLQGDEILQLKDRLDGQVLASLAGTGCTQARPCDARLSPQAAAVALLDTNKDTVNYHREVLATRMQIWDWQSGDMLSNENVFTRNLDGILPAEDGGCLTTADRAEEGIAPLSWWTSSSNFDGLLVISNTVTFKPQVIDYKTEDSCYYCGTCSLNPAGLQITCQNRFFSQENDPWEVIAEDGQFHLQGTDESKSFELRLPAEAQADWDLRLVGFSEKYETAFYCLDEQGRSQRCAVYSGGNIDKLTTMEDIYGLRFSPDGSTAAYIDRREKALFLLNLETGKLTKMDAYQSRAWFVNPVFASQNKKMEAGEEPEAEADMVYVIQNLNDESILSLEWVDGAQTKVLRRSTLDAAIGRPSALGLGTENGLVAIGTQDGEIFLLESEKGEQAASWQAGVNRIIGLFCEGR
jgi:hypothetical protein